MQYLKHFVMMIVVGLAVFDGCAMQPNFLAQFQSGDDADYEEVDVHGAGIMEGSERVWPVDSIDFLLSDSEEEKIEEDDEKKPALIEQVIAGNVGEVQRLLLAKAAVDETDKDGYTALLEACMLRDMRCVKLLCEAKADPWMITNNGSNAFDLARRFGTKEIAQYLESLEISKN